MPKELETALLVVVLLAVVVFGGYQIYRNWGKKGSTDLGMVDLVAFILSNADQFVDSIQYAFNSMESISRDKYESDKFYKDELIKTAITVIETKAKEAGINFSLSHDSLVNIAGIAIDMVISTIERNKREADLIKASVSVALLERDSTPKKVDITDEIISDESTF